MPPESNAQIADELMRWEKEAMNNKGSNKRSTHLGLFLILAFAGVILFYGLGVRIQEHFNRPQGNDEILVYLYTTGPERGNMYLYDPIKNTHTQIFENYEINSFGLSSNRRIAFSAESELGKKDIFIAEYPFTEDPPTNISSGLEGDGYIISWHPAWSPDGEYLAFHNTRPNGESLLVWTEGSITSIYDYDVSVSETTWSNDNQLAFTEFITFFFSRDYVGDSAEVYLWDGKITTSVSQNPRGDDRFPDWSDDGQLAFLSEVNNEYDIYVWDGQSRINSVPDIDSYINIAPEHTFYYTMPTWTSENSIIINNLYDSSRSLVYEWDGNNEEVFSKPPVNEIYAVYQHALSNTGLATFCMYEYEGEKNEWVLKLWNTYDVVEIARGGYIDAIWENGESVHCSSG